MTDKQNRFADLVKSLFPHLMGEALMEAVEKLDLLIESQLEKKLKDLDIPDQEDLAEFVDKDDMADLVEKEIENYLSNNVEIPDPRDFVKNDELEDAFRTLVNDFDLQDEDELDEKVDAKLDSEEFEAFLKSPTMVELPGLVNILKTPGWRGFFRRVKWLFTGE